MADQDLTAAVGATIYIGPASPTATTLAAYDALTWTEIGLVDTIPEFGTKWETGSFTVLSSGLKKKYKTTLDNGSLQVSAAKSGSDAGQKAAKAAAADKQNAYAIKIALSDDGATPTRFYFPALVTSATTKIGTATDTVTTTLQLEITGEIVDSEA